MKQPTKNSNTDPARHNRGSIKKEVATIAGGAAVLLTVGAVWLNTNKQGSVSKAQRIEAVKGIDQSDDSNIVLRAGTVEHFVPSFSKPGQSAEDDPHNIAGKVPKGKEWIVRMPLASSNSNDGWIAFTPPATKTASINSLDARAERTVWVNVQDLQREGYAQAYNLNGQPRATANFETATAQVEANGQVVVAKGDASPSIATAIQLTAGSYEQLVQQQQG